MSERRTELARSVGNVLRSEPATLVGSFLTASRTSPLSECIGRAAFDAFVLANAITANGSFQPNMGTAIFYCFQGQSLLSRLTCKTEDRNLIN